MRIRGEEAAWDYAERRRRERNYRVMFRCALAFLALGIALTILGGTVAVTTDADGLLFSCGLMLALLSAASAWLSLDSTVRIIELDMKDAHSER